MPTNKFCPANLSLVLISKRQDTAIQSITSKKSATKRPDKTIGVMLRNRLLAVVGGAVVCSSSR